MIDIIEASRIAASRGPVETPLVWPDPPQLLQGASIDLLEDVIEATASGTNPINSLLPKLKALSAEYGWLTTASVLSYRFAEWYRPDAVPNIPGIEQNAVQLLRVLPVYAELGPVDVGPDWTTPTIILEEAGEEDALNFTACAAFCASVKYLRSDMTSRIDGGKS